MNRPRFLQSAGTGSLDPVHRPTPASRRGEALAWACAGLAALGTISLALRAGQLSGLGVGLTVVLLIAAGLISFGNWLDRHTQIELGEEQVVYHSPLRQVALAYDDICQLTVTSLRGSWRVGVVGAISGFSFRTGTKLEFGGMDSLSYGFEHGEGLAAALRQLAGLEPAERHGEQWVSRRPDPGTAGSPTPEGKSR